MQSKKVLKVLWIMQMIKKKLKKRKKKGPKYFETLREKSEIKLYKKKLFFN